MHGDGAAYDVEATIVCLTAACMKYAGLAQVSGVWQQHGLHV